MPDETHPDQTPSPETMAAQVRELEAEVNELRRRLAASTSFQGESGARGWAGAFGWLLLVTRALLCLRAVWPRALGRRARRPPAG